MEVVEVSDPTRGPRVTSGPPLPDMGADLLADRDAWSTAGCSVDRALGVVGSRTAMLVLREAFYGTRRFQDFAQRVGMTDAATAHRLRDLVQQGLLVKTPYRPDGSRTRLEYRLTPKGLDLLPGLLALMQWGDRWLSETGGPLLLSHAGCGQAVGVQIRCAAGHPVAPGRIQVALNGDTPPTQRGEPPRRGAIHPS